MIAKGEITKKGVLSTAIEVPCNAFMDRLNTRGIRINEKIEQSI